MQILSNLFLVRHAQSHANVDSKVLHKLTNMHVKLTETGREQARETGLFLAKLLKQNNMRTKIWNSPYTRTRETADIIKSVLDSENIQYLEEESIYISERQFGLVDTLPEYYTQYPNESSFYKFHKNANVDFFAKPPLGESPYDMCLRLDSFLRNVIPQTHEMNHIIVSHGAAIKGMLMMKQALPYEEYLKMTTPNNASVNHIEGQISHGCIWNPTIITN